jgi:hypothetical protein
MERRGAQGAGLIDIPSTVTPAEDIVLAQRQAIIDRAYTHFVADIISDFTAKDGFTLTPEQLALAGELVEMNLENIPDSVSIYKKLIIDRYGLEGEEPLSHGELEQKHGLKKGKARKLLGNARMMLRSPGRLKGLRDTLGITEANFGNQEAA